MASPYLSEIRIFSFNFAPRGWLFCNGQTLPINQYQALFALLSTTYGGNGQSTFQLPNLQGAVALGFGNGAAGNFVLGQIGGEANHTLSVNEMPPHTHAVNASNAAGSQAGPAGNVWAKEPNGSLTYGSNPNTNLNANAINAQGGGQPHPNMMPYLVLNFCIAISGIFPSQG